jgi:hypothetical protein
MVPGKEKILWFSFTLFGEGAGGRGMMIVNIFLPREER